MTETHEPLNLDLVTNAGLATHDPDFAEEAETPMPDPQPEVAARAAYEAEFESYRRRVRKELDEHEVRAREAILLDFLEVADNLERATAAWKEGGVKTLKSVQDGIDSVLHHFRSKLARYAVTAIEAEGKPFDPRVHHAVSQSTSTDTMPGTVLHEVHKGYLMDGRLLRPAAVVVAAAPAKASEADASDEDRGTGDDPASDWHGYQRNRR
jgi:molecular chaperone GrpE (heat shock protein)